MASRLKLTPACIGGKVDRGAGKRPDLLRHEDETPVT
jgi:hypothetical protein